MESLDLNMMWSKQKQKKEKSQQRHTTGPGCPGGPVGPCGPVTPWRQRQINAVVCHHCWS